MAQRALDFGFSCTDREVMNEGWLDGSTSVVLAVTSRYIMVANAGDSRAVLMDGNTAVPLSCDHKPSRPDEMRRIEKAGGFVMQLGVPRVNGVLAVSRALGDAELKQLVPAQPEYRTIARSVTHRFAALATDGVWDVMTNQEVMDLIADNWHQEGHGARVVALEAYNRGSFDNICILILDLSPTAAGLPQIHVSSPSDTDASSSEFDRDDAPIEDSQEESTPLTTLSEGSAEDEGRMDGVRKERTDKYAEPGGTNVWQPEWEEKTEEDGANEYGDVSDSIDVMA
eukprot:Tamp_22264.p1 GENE.Tamp_22264~~Tamp_22264.p1  ORF type:complete len:284 (-),score=33.99 Tamp_22264:235-1086(-)